MPRNLKRITGRGDLHFITFCCYQRRPLLAPARTRNLAVQILKEIRARYRFRIVGYIIMPGAASLWFFRVRVLTSVLRPASAAFEATRSSGRFE